jgi:transposase
MRRYALRDDQWERIKDLLPGRKGHVGVTAKDNRLFVEAVLYRYRAGIPWRDLPERFGDWHNIYTRFSRWSRSGVWAKVFLHLAEEADNDYAMIDSTIVRAHQHSAGARKKVAVGTRRSGAAVAVRAPRSTPWSTRSATRPGLRSRRVRRMTWREPMPCCPRLRRAFSLATRPLMRSSG